MEESYLELQFDAKQANIDFGKGIDICLVTLGPKCYIFSITPGTEKHLEIIDHAHILNLFHKLLSSSEEGEDLSIGFDMD